MEIIILDSINEIWEEAGRRVVSLINAKPDAVIGFSTGETIKGVYRYLINAYKEGQIDFSLITTFNISEYLGILPNEKISFRNFMEKNLFKHINIPGENINMPSSLPEDAEEECLIYEEKIKKAKGIDLFLLEIGEEGRLGFNEPTSSFNSRTRIKTLTEETYKTFFPQGKGPRFAITMGLRTIIESKEIILLAAGNSRAKEILQLIEGPQTSFFPASILQLHEKVKIIIDKEAAKYLQKKDYYIWVYKNKRKVEKETFYGTEIIKVKTPSRICLFGEHQDYLNLPVITAAIDLPMKIVAEKQKELFVSVFISEFNKRIEFELKIPLKYKKKRDYIRSVFNVLARKGVKFKWGIKGAISSQIPVNAGISSSSALTVSLVKLILELAEDPRKDYPEIIADLAYEAEVIEFGEAGGKMDHYSCAIGGILLIDFPNKKIKRLNPPIENFLISNSMHPKGTIKIVKEIKYKQEEALKELKEIYPPFDLKSTTFEEVKDLIKKIPEELRNYAEGAIKNREITEKAIMLFKKDKFDKEAFGKLLLEHHKILRNLLKISTIDIEKMLNIALKAGALGGKINGSGGGGTISIYAPGREEFVKEALLKIGKPAYIVNISEGVNVF